MNKAKLSKIVRNTPCQFCRDKVLTIIEYIKNGTAEVECAKCGQRHLVSIKLLKDKIEIKIGIIKHPKYYFERIG